MRKPVIVHDVDGVVADFVGHLWCSLATANSTPPYPPDAPHLQGVWDVIGTLPDRQRSTAKDILKKPEFWSTIPMMSGARSYSRYLRDTFHICWTTSPWVSCFGWADVRAEWLRRHDLLQGEDSLIVTADKHHVRGDVMIDDRRSNVEKWALHHPRGHAVLLATHHNRPRDNFKDRPLMELDGLDASRLMALVRAPKA